MLYLIGMGFEEKDITLKGIEAAKSCDEVFCELYTSSWLGRIEKLEEIVGKKIRRVGRKDLEEELENFLESVKNRNVALLVPGDPLVATTHSAILVEAEKIGIKTEVIHAPSIFSAIAECGLHVYKFGKSATIPETMQLEHVKNAIEINRKHALHTLLLLDVRMPAERALEELAKRGLVKKSERVVVASRIGTEKSKIMFSEVENLLRERFPEPSVIVIPGELHFTEREFLKRYEL